MVNGNQQPTPQLPDLAQLLSAPMSVLDAQTKAFTEGLANILNMGSASVSTVLSSLQTPLAQPTEPIKEMLMAPFTMAKQFMAPLANGQLPAPPALPGMVAAPVGYGNGAVPAAPATPAAPMQMYTSLPGEPGGTPPGIPEGGTVFGVGGVFNIVKPV